MNLVEACKIMSRIDHAILIESTREREARKRVDGESVTIHKINADAFRALRNDIERILAEMVE